MTHQRKSSEDPPTRILCRLRNELKAADKHFSFVEWSQRFGSNILETIPK